MTGGGRVIRTEAQHDTCFEFQKPIETVLITSEEMKKFLKEWIGSGSPDLTIDDTLCDRIYQYIEYQKELREAKSRLIEDALDRFIVKKELVSTDYESITFNRGKETLLEIEVSFYEEEIISPVLQLMRVRDFKRLMAKLGNRLMSYAYIRQDEDFINFPLFFYEKGVKLRWVDMEDSCSLIFPENWEW